MFATYTDGFLNTRSRMQRLEDARFFSGWVTGFVGNHLSMRIGEGDDLQVGDRLYVCINSATCSATFQAIVTGRVMQDTSLIVETSPKYGKPTEGVRYSTDAMSGHLKHNGRPLELTIGDISEKGLGGHIPMELPRGTSVEFDVEGVYGRIGGQAEVRYCRQDPAKPGTYRVGLLILHVGRIDQARWIRTLGAQAA